jgi:hypothetical protein
MSIEDLHDIATQLHKFAEEGGTHRAPTLQETHLLFTTALRAVHELESLERRVAALEEKAPRVSVFRPPGDP